MDASHSTSSQRGATLIEVIVAVTLLAVAFGPLFGALHLGERMERRAEKNIKALYLAQQLLERKTGEIKLDWNRAVDGLSEEPSISDGFNGEITVEPSLVLGIPDICEVSVRVWTSTGESCRLTTWVAKRAN